MSDLEELSDEAEIERRNQQSPKYEWEYVHSEKNLSQEGNCWIYHDAQVYDNAHVHGNAWVSGNARVYGNAQIYSSALVSGYVHAYGNAKVFDKAVVCGDTVVSDDSKTDKSVYKTIVLDGIEYNLVPK